MQGLKHRLHLRPPSPAKPGSAPTKILGAVNPARDRLAVWHTRDLPCPSLPCTDTESHFLFDIQWNKTRALPAHGHPRTSAGREVLHLVSEAPCHPKQHPQQNSSTSKGNGTKIFADGLHTFSLKYMQQFLFSQKRERERNCDRNTYTEPRLNLREITW